MEKLRQQTPAQWEVFQYMTLFKQEMQQLKTRLLQTLCILSL